MELKEAADAPKAQSRGGWIPVGKLGLLAIIVLLATTTQVIRIATVKSSTGELPFLSANDRSRWCTILALVANGSYAIDEVIQIRDPVTKRRTWYTIDRVQHRGPDGKQHTYSSKPPLLSTLYAGVYWLLRGVTGATLTAQPFVVARWMLILVNLLPLVVLWIVMLRWAYHHDLRRWQLMHLAIFITFGTFLSTFVITLNNHLPAAVAAGLSLACAQRIVLRGDLRKRWFVGCGLAVSFAAVNELPALAWLAVMGGVLTMVDTRRSLLYFFPCLLPAALAFFGTNYLAHGTLRPPYAMRDVGRQIGSVELPDEFRSATPDLSAVDAEPIVSAFKELGIPLSQQSVVLPARRPGVWQLWDEDSQWRFGLKPDLASGQLQLFEWGDWYDYPGTYWTADRKQGVDRGEPSRLRYAFHCIIGHHGILSLTPFWFLSLVGLWNIVSRQPKALNWRLWHTDGQWLLTLAIAVTTFVVIGFYLTRPMEDRNYGGVTSGLRWTFWLIPLWYWLAIRGIAGVQSRGTKALVTLALVISVASATYPWGNPWTSPWLTRLILP
jgi:hypothetical protein